MSSPIRGSAEQDEAAVVHPAEWMPIETAPKDGTTILAWSEYCSEPITVSWCRANSWVAAWFGSWDGSTVIGAQGDWGTDYKEAPPLTHWMPLPSPPSEDEGTEKASDRRGGE